MSENRKPEQGIKLRGAEKVARIPVKLFLRLKRHVSGLDPRENGRSRGSSAY